MCLLHLKPLSKIAWEIWMLLWGTVCHLKHTQARVNSRSVMLLNVLGCTRTTLTGAISSPTYFKSWSFSVRSWVTFQSPVIPSVSRVRDRCLVIIYLERGIPSKCRSSSCVDCVPATCTHRPSLLLMAWSQRPGECLDINGSPFYIFKKGKSLSIANLSNVAMLEEAKVVTRLL